MTAQPEIPLPPDPNGPVAGTSVATMPGGATGLAPVVETASSAVAARERAAVEARFVMAARFPRSIDSARLRILDACKRPRFAESARYSKPVGKSRVEGLSIRFAEEAARGWGNLDVTAMVVFDDGERRIYRVTGTDLETNATQSQDVLIEKVVERRQPRQGQTVIGQRQNTKGETVYLIEASEDELHNKVNAMIAKARRNIILTLIPSDISEEADETIQEVVRARDTKDPAGARKQILNAFWGLGVTPEAVTEFMQKPLEQLNPAELSTLRAIYTAIKDGETTWAAAIEELGGKVGTGPKKTERGAGALKQRLDDSRAPAGEVVPSPTPVAPVAPAKPAKQPLPAALTDDDEKY